MGTHILLCQSHSFPLDLAFVDINTVLVFVCGLKSELFKHEVRTLLHFPNISLLTPTQSLFLKITIILLPIFLLFFRTIILPICLTMAAQSDCDDCGLSFPLATDHGELCRKCKRLAPLQFTSEKYKEILVCFWLLSASFRELT